MTKEITNNEVYVSEFAAFIRTRCEKRFVTDDMIARLVGSPAIKLSAGDKITVQCFSHDRDTVYWERCYTVAQRHDYLKRTTNLQGNPHTADAFDVCVLPSGDWLPLMPEPERLEAVDKGPVHKWWVVDLDGKAVAKGLDQATAERIVAGDELVPVKEQAA